jgi:hypothetical protein
MKGHLKEQIFKIRTLFFLQLGYKSQFDAFANSLALFLNIGTTALQESIILWILKINGIKIIACVLAN